MLNEDQEQETTNSTSNSPISMDEYHVTAVSGIGVEFNLETGTSMKTVLDRTITFEDVEWNYKAAALEGFIPDAVIMLIGPNDLVDLSNQSSVTKFQQAYYDLISQVNTNYKEIKLDIPIISVCAGSINGLYNCDSIQESTSQWNKRNRVSQAYFTSIRETTWKKINRFWGHSWYNGCDMHYDFHGHKAVADEIRPQIERIMGWSTGSHTKNTMNKQVYV
jgi:hypothetical protein